MELAGCRGSSTSGPAQRGRRRERRRDRALHVGRATPDQPPVVDRAGPGIVRPGVGRAGGHDVEVAVPRQRGAGAVPDRGDHAGASRVGPHDRAGRRPGRGRIAQATSAASSSVPPGFSLGAAISARANATTSSGSTAPTAAVGARDRGFDRLTLPWRAMVHCRGSRRSAAGGARARSPAAAGGPGTDSPRCLAPLIMEPEPSLMFTVRAAALSRHAGEISFPGGLQDPGETLVQTALREAHEEIGLRSRRPEVVGALAADAHVRERHPGRAVRGHAGDAARADRERRARSTRCSPFPVGASRGGRGRGALRPAGRQAPGKGSPTSWTGDDLGRHRAGCSTCCSRRSGRRRRGRSRDSRWCRTTTTLRRSSRTPARSRWSGLSSKPGRAVARRRGVPAGTGLPDHPGQPAGDRGAGRDGLSIAARHPRGCPRRHRRRVPASRGHAGGRPRCGGDRRQGVLAPARHRERGSGSDRLGAGLGRHHGDLHQADRATFGAGEPRNADGTQRWGRP